MKIRQARTRSNQLHERKFFRRIFIAISSRWRIGAVALFGFAAGCATQTKVGKTDNFFRRLPISRGCNS